MSHHMELKVVRRDPPPSPQPPPTYDIVGLSGDDLRTLIEVCQRATYIATTLHSTGIRAPHHAISDVLNRIYHACIRASQVSK